MTLVFSPFFPFGLIQDEEAPDPGTWAEASLHDPLEVDCVTTVMLKILDGKCKMGQQEKQVMAVLYQVVRERPGKVLPARLHALIARAQERIARKQVDEALIMEVYEARLLAETALTRPVMKAFKARLRQVGILGRSRPEAESEDFD